MESQKRLRAGLSTVTHGTLFLILATLCLVLFNFLSRVLLVRGLSPTDWDDFSIGFTLTLVLSAVGTLGLPNAVARSVPYAADDAERRAIVRTTILGGVAAAIGVAGALALAAPLIGRALGAPAVGLGLEFFAVAIGSSIVATTLAAVFQGYADVTPNALFVQILNPALFFVFLTVARLTPSLGLTYRSALAAYALANAGALVAIAAYSAVRLRRLLPPGPRAPGKGAELLRFARPLFVMGAMASVAGSADTLVLGAYHLGEVGTYTATLTLARLIQIGINAASYILLPVAARFHRDADRTSIRLTYATITKWMMLFSLPLFLLFVFIPHGSLQFVFGSNYSTVVLPLQITVFGAFLGTVLGPATTTQLAYGQVRALAINSTIAAALDVGIALALVPSYGYVGAAVAWALSTVAYAGLCLAGLYAADGVHPFGRDFVVPLLVTAVPLALLFLVAGPRVPTYGLVPLGLAVVVVFVLAVIGTRSVDAGDRHLLGVVEALLGRPVPWVRRWARWAVRDRS